MSSLLNCSVTYFIGGDVKFTFLIIGRNVLLFLHHLTKFRPNPLYFSCNISLYFLPSLIHSDPSVFLLPFVFRSHILHSRLTTARKSYCVPNPHVLTCGNNHTTIYITHIIDIDKIHTYLLHTLVNIK